MHCKRKAVQKNHKLCSFSFVWKHLWCHSILPLCLCVWLSALQPLTVVAFLTRGVGRTPVEGQFPRGSSSPQHGHSIILRAYFIRSYGSGIKCKHTWIYFFLHYYLKDIRNMTSNWWRMGERDQDIMQFNLNITLPTYKCHKNLGHINAAM